MATRSGSGQASCPSPRRSSGSRSASGWPATCVLASGADPRRQRLLLYALEDVGVRFLLPLRQLLPVGHVGRLGVGEVLEDLADPAQGDEAALLSSAELGCLPVGGLDEGADLVVDGRRAFAFPIGSFLPRCDVAGLWLAGVVLLDAGDPRLAQDVPLFCLRLGFPCHHRATKAPVRTMICLSRCRMRLSLRNGARSSRRPWSLRAMTPDPL